MTDQIFYNSLKPGMKVRIRPDLKPRTLVSSKGYNPGITGDMTKLAGDVVILQAKWGDGCWRLEKSPWTWPDTAFIPASKGFNKLLSKI